MKDIKRNFNILTWGQIGLDIVLFLLGLYFVCNPEISTTVIEKCVGLILTIDGLYKILRFIVNMDKKGIFMCDIPYGILEILIGIIVLTNPFSLSSGVTVFMGVWLLIASSFKLALAIQFKRCGEETWVLNLVISILTAIAAIIMIVNPFESYIVLASFVGIMICVYTAIDAIQQLLFRKRVKEVVKIFFR